MGLDPKSCLKTSDISDVLMNVIDSISVERDMQISLRNLQEFDCVEKPLTLFLIPALAEVQFLEEVIALVVDHDKGREVFDLDLPDGFHAELGIFQNLDLLDAILR